MGGVRAQNPDLRIQQQLLNYTFSESFLLNSTTRSSLIDLRWSFKALTSTDGQSQGGSGFYNKDIAELIEKHTEQKRKAKKWN